jgi:hypothetical protein
MESEAYTRLAHTPPEIDRYRRQERCEEHQPHPHQASTHFIGTDMALYW